MLDAIWQDIKYASRGLRSAPGFAAIVVMTLALGIGANAAMFSVVNAVLLKPLPYPESQRIVSLVTATPGGLVPVDSATRFEFWQRNAHTLEHTSAYRAVAVNVTSGEAGLVLSLQITPSFLELFGVQLAEGRAFTAEEYRASGAKTAILSHGFWQRSFAGNPQVVGRTVSLDGVPHVIVGVLKDGFSFETLPFVPSVPASDVLVPLPQSRVDSPVRYLVGVARLKPNATLSVANAEAQQAADALRREFPAEIGTSDTFRVELLQETVAGGVRQPLVILLGAVGFVLLVACANVANLSLIRGSVRQRELAIRTAIGASTGRLVRQLLAESVMLSIAAGSLGLIIGLVSVRLLLLIKPSYLPKIGDHGSAVNVDWRVLMFTAFVSLLAAVTFGVLPAMLARRPNANTGLAEYRSGNSRDARRLHGTLVVVEIALALMLVVGAGLLIRTLIAIRAVDPGFEANGVVNVPMVLSGPRFEKTAAVAQVVGEGVRRLRSIPDVTSAAAGCCPPMMGRYELPFIVSGRPLTGRAHGIAGWVNVSAGYFDLFRIPLIRGRSFADADTGGAPGVVIINEAMARRFWSKEDPLNDRLLIGQGFSAAEEPARQIVGIVGDVRDGDLTGEAVPMMYVPTAQMTDAYTSLHSRSPMLWFVRTDRSISLLAADVDRELRNASAGVPVATTMIRSMQDVMSESIAAADFQTTLMAIFAGMALLLAAVGVYGVTSYSVHRRTQEIGIRLAVGARQVDMLFLVVREGMRVTAVGIALGVATALMVGRLVRALLFGISPTDPLTYVTVIVILTAVALLASLLPAIRAARLDPMTALRIE
jgi:predicted permease